MYLAAGVPGGTGVGASAGGAVVTPRLEGEGKRWSLPGAAALRAWRSLQKSHDHDLRPYGRFRAHQGRPRRSGRQPQYRPTTRLRRLASFDVQWLRSFALTSAS